ncbi:MAG: glycosyltransferase [Candidatus Marinimicrobia bacterium]|nr:glycosyltransferase [Candidatus Neomarinimicrobiota bacterium]MDD5581712.1 glycosyltransferase [Candidatus Neomarinimicrobiota bacterium]
MKQDINPIMDIDLSIIIVSYNVRDLLKQCLLSINNACKSLTVEIFVVDNRSVDGTPDMIHKDFPHVHLIANSENLGFGKANNQALKSAQGKYTLFLNPDTIIREDTLVVMMQFMETHPETGVAGCKILNIDGSLQLACRRSFPRPSVAIFKMLGLSALFPKSSVFAKYNLTYLDPDKCYPVDAVSGSFMFCRTSLVKSLNGFDERFFMYGEDLDLCYRVKQAGYQVTYVPDTTIVHYKGESSKSAPFDNLIAFYRAMDQFVRKHFHPRKWILSVLVLRLGILFHLMLHFIGKILYKLRAPLLDIFLIVIAHALALVIRFRDFSWFFKYQPIIPLYAMIYLGSILALGTLGNRKFDYTRTFGGVILGGLINGCITFFIPPIAHSRLVFIIAFLLTLLFLPGWRLIYHIFLRKRTDDTSTLRKALIVGAGEKGQQLAKTLTEHPETGYLFVGFADHTFNHPQTISKINDIPETVRMKHIDDIIIVLNEIQSSEMMQIMNHLQSIPVNIKIVPENIDTIYGKTHLENIDDIAMVDVQFNIYQPVPAFLKRFFDIVGSSLLLILLAIPAGLSRIFNSPFSKWYGKLLLILKGDWTFVGDDATVPDKKKYYKPGLTGILQLEKSESITAEEHERYMTFYMRNYSIMMDIEILVKRLSGIW